MLTAAGIDTLLFDQTNALVYPDEMLAVCENLEQGRLQGLPVPKEAAMHNSRLEKSVPKLHAALYAPQQYPELWFRWLGKPLLLSNPEKLPQEMKDFFTIRHTWARTSAPWFGDPSCQDDTNNEAQYSVFDLERANDSSKFDSLEKG